MNVKNEIGWWAYPIAHNIGELIACTTHGNQLTKFAMCMLLSGILASSVAWFEYGVGTASTMFLWWAAVVAASSMIIKRWLL